MSESCLDPCLRVTFDIFSAPRELMNSVSGIYTEISKDVKKGETCAGHLVWAWPVNALLNIVQIALSPLVALVNLIAAAIFGVFSCCSESCKVAAKVLFINSIATLSNDLFTAIVRIASPSFENPETCSRVLGECLFALPPPFSETEEARLQMVTTVISELRHCLVLLKWSEVKDGTVPYSQDRLVDLLRRCAREALCHEHGDRFVRAIREKLQAEIPENLSAYDFERVFELLPSKNNAEMWEHHRENLIEGMRDIQLPNLGETLSDWDDNPRLNLLGRIDNDALGLGSLNDPTYVWQFDIRAIEAREAANRQVINVVLAGIVQCAGLLQPSFSINENQLRIVAQNALRFEHPEIVVGIVFDALAVEPISSNQFLPLFQDLTRSDVDQRQTAYAKKINLTEEVGQCVTRVNNQATPQVTQIVQARLGLLGEIPLEPFINRE